MNHHESAAAVFQSHIFQSHILLAHILQAHIFYQAETSTDFILMLSQEHTTAQLDIIQTFLSNTLSIMKSKGCYSKCEGSQFSWLNGAGGGFFPLIQFSSILPVDFLCSGIQTPRVTLRVFTFLSSLVQFAI